MENPDHDELIAYLDGELDPRTSQQVEERLKHDPAYRQALTLYERSWDMLDRLERATVGDNFSRTTLEMVSLAAAEEQEQLPTAARFPLRRAGIVGLAVVVALVLGYAGGRAIWPDPNRELLQDLPILENFDLFEQAGSIDFLRKLAATGLFGGAAGQVTPPPGLAVPETLTDRQEELARMTPAEKEHLARKFERFDAYSAHEEQRLRQLYESLNHDADGKQLRDVLVRYHDWLDTLVSGVREELNNILSDDERIDRIGKIKAEQETLRKKERVQAPTEQDLAAIVTWFEDFSWQNRKALLATLSDKRRQYLEGLTEKPQHRALLWMWMMQHGSPGRLRLGQLHFTETDFARLAEQLSPGARARLEAIQEPQDKRKLVSQWGQTAVRHQVESAGGMRQFLPSVSAVELQRFARDELSIAQREALSPVRYKKFFELLRLYFMPVNRLTEMKPEEITAGFPAHGGSPPHRGADGRPPGGAERQPRDGT